MKTKLLILSLLFYGFVSAQTIELETFATGFTNPVEIVNAGDERLFVVEQRGIIKIVNPDRTTNQAPFLDITSLVASSGEQGLLGLAFHPNYATTGHFFINYTNTQGNTVIARYARDTANPQVANAGSAVTLLTINQPATNHNGGSMHFGPDGYLYISTGDGGGGGDPDNNSQNLNTLLGKMLRIDVDSGSPYSSPADNPFVGSNGMDEIWAYGLRNAWKFSFNKQNGDLWIADVGQDNREEINQVSPTEAGLNFGWRCYEGTLPYNTDGCPEDETLTFPLAEYNHSNGRCSITGGYVYTGSTYPNLQGKYLFADFCSNEIGWVDTEGDITYASVFPDSRFTTFGEDARGELYIASSSQGSIYIIKDSSLSTPNYAMNPYFIYPNPAKDVIHIYNNSLVNTAEAHFLDPSGKILHSQRLENIPTNSIDINFLASGFYILNITNNEERSSYKITVE